jgi:ubiquinone/menaquinone biosynthesis C-methylase UbiE
MNIAWKNKGAVTKNNGNYKRTMKAIDVNSPFDSLAADYDRWFDSKDGNIIFASEVRALKKVLPALPKPWLEIGVGSGRFAQALGITTGLDLSGRLLEIARSRGIITLQGNIEDYSLPSESFGTVFLIMTLSFIERPAVALKEIRRILKPAGRIVLGDVPSSSCWGELYLHKKLNAHPFYEKANFYAYDELTNLLEQAGFKIDMTVSTLLQKPGQLTTLELPLNDYHKDAGFLVIAATRTSSAF